MKAFLLKALQWTALIAAGAYAVHGGLHNILAALMGVTAVIGILFMIFGMVCAVVGLKLIWDLFKGMKH